MRKTLCILFLINLTVLTSPTRAFAQGLAYAEGGLAGVSGFFGRWSDSFHVGGGGEFVAGDRVGIGGEVGFFNRLIVGSANATVYPVRASARFSPFVTGGITRMGIGDGEGGFQAFNIGAGLHYWAGEHVGFRTEFRDHIRPGDRGPTQYCSVRAGVVVR